MSTRRCLRCHDEKPVPDEFYTCGRKNGNVKYNSWCKQCCKEHEAIRYATDPAVRERKQKQSVKWRTENPERTQKLQADWRDNHTDYGARRYRTKIKPTLAILRAMKRQQQIDELLEREKELKEKHSAISPGSKVFPPCQRAG